MPFDFIYYIRSRFCSISLVAGLHQGDANHLVPKTAVLSESNHPHHNVRHSGPVWHKLLYQLGLFLKS